MLETLSQHPDQVDNPLDLGDVLFLSGHPKEAAVFYREALNRSSSDQAGLAQDRAWILFQAGNCLRDDDPQMAMKMYRQLITEHPDSAWTDLAQTWDKLIDWHQKDKPRALIAEGQL
jgi:tetratricopeptide (TPR) repeat protein